MQFAFHQVVFTSLLEYKTHGTNARPFLTLTHYPELIDSKGIVLMSASLLSDPRVLTIDQAQVLTFGLQQYYVSDHKDKLQLLQDFHKRPEQFSHQKLIELTEITG
jgi:ATP synthase F1 complex assembly factor 1